MKVLLASVAAAALSLATWASSSSFDSVDTTEVASVYGGACIKYIPSSCRPFLYRDSDGNWKWWGYHGCGSQKGSCSATGEGTNSTWFNYQYCIQDDGVICGFVATTLYECSFEPPQG